MEAPAAIKTVPVSDGVEGMEEAIETQPAAAPCLGDTAIIGSIECFDQQRVQ